MAPVTPSWIEYIVYIYIYGDVLYMDPIFERPLRGVNWVWNRVLKASLISPWVSLHHPLGILLYIHIYIYYL